MVSTRIGSATDRAKPIMFRGGCAVKRLRQRGTRAMNTTASSGTSDNRLEKDLKTRMGALRL